MAAPDSPYYRRDLALVHHVGFGAHAEACAPGILERLRPVRERGGLVLEVGCGSGLLTRHLVAAGHRVVATDASPAMIALAREVVSGAEDIRVLALPEDPMPPADAVVSVGHVLNYLPDEAAIDRALVSIAEALRPGGTLAIDLCDLEYGSVRAGAQPHCQVSDEWAIVARFSIPSPNRFVRDITTFVHAFDGSWRRDDERHVNVLVDTSRVPALLAEHGVRAKLEAAFGSEELPAGLRVISGTR
jgi:SAM-dependent methyltransferase